MCKEEEGSVTVRPCGHKYCPGIVARGYDCECGLDTMIVHVVESIFRTIQAWWKPTFIGLAA